MEFTPNFNGNDGGFLVDPNAAQFGGTFGVGIGRGDSRNNAFFARPSAGAWHHYALVLDTHGAGARQQITPYVDGQPVTYTEARQRHRRRQLRQLDADFMSRDGTACSARATSTRWRSTTGP